MERMHKNFSYRYRYTDAYRGNWTCKISVKEFTQSLKNFLQATTWINECLLLYVSFIPSSTSTGHTTCNFIYRFNIFQKPQNSQVKYISHISPPKYIKFSGVVNTHKFTACTYTYHRAQVSFLITWLHLSQIWHYQHMTLRKLIKVTYHSTEF